MSKIEKSVQNLIFLLTFSGLLLLLASIIVTVYWLDDFWMLIELADKGIWGTVKFFYFNWDGRAFSPIFTIRNMIIWLVPYQKAYLASIPSLLSLGLTALVLFKFFCEDSSRLKKSDKVIWTSLIAFGLWMGFASHMSTTVYWVTGSYYVYVNLVSVLSIYFLIKRPSSLLLNSILLIILGLSGVNLILMAGFFLIVNLKLKLSNITKFNFNVYIAIFIITLTIVIAAPGNFERANGRFDFSLSSLLTNYFHIIGGFLFLSRWILFLPIFLAFFIKQKSENSGKMSFLFFGISFVYLIPFAALEDSASIRTAITFQTMLFLGIFFLFSYFFRFIEIQFSKSFFNLGVLLIFGYFHWVIIRQIVFGVEVQKQLKERYEYLQTISGTNKRIYLKNLQIDERNYINNIFDLSTDPEYEFNRYTAKYFSVGEVVVR